MCKDCLGSGYRTVEVPVFADGNYSDVEQLTGRCACNPVATDADYLRTHPWHDDRAQRPTPMVLDPDEDPETYALYLSVAD